MVQRGVVVDDCGFARRNHCGRRNLSARKLSEKVPSFFQTTVNDTPLSLMTVCSNTSHVKRANIQNVAATSKRSCHNQTTPPPNTRPLSQVTVAHLLDRCWKPCPRWCPIGLDGLPRNKRHRDQRLAASLTSSVLRLRPLLPRRGELASKRLRFQLLTREFLLQLLQALLGCERSNHVLPHAAVSFGRDETCRTGGASRVVLEMESTLN